MGAPGPGATITQAIPFAQINLRTIIPGIKVRNDLPPLDTPEDVCRYLTPPMLSKIKADFKRAHNKMTKQQFVPCMARHLMMQVPNLLLEDRATMVVALLHALFTRLDLDCPHGLVHWQGFTTFCVDAGMRQTSTADTGAAPSAGGGEAERSYRYEVDPSYSNAVSRGGRAARLQV